MAKNAKLGKPSKRNKKEINRIVNYLSKGDGAEGKLPKGCIVSPDDYRTHALSEATELDAIVVISKDNHLLSENFPAGVPVYFITTQRNIAPFEEPKNMRGVMRVPTYRLDILIEEASNLLWELFPKVCGKKNIAVYCDAPLLTAQLLATKHRLYIAEHKMSLKTMWDYDYIVSAFVVSVKASRLRRGRTIGEAILRRPSPRDGAMQAVIKKFYGLLDTEDLEILNLSRDFIESVIQERRKLL